MFDEIIYVFYFIFSLFVFFLLILYYKNKDKKSLAKIEDLGDEVGFLNLEIVRLQNKLEAEEYRLSQTSYIQAEIQKREVLEKEIQRLLNTVSTTKTIAQDASMVKTEFLANIRHEIRTPLNSILGFADLLRKRIENHELSTFAENIYASGNKLLRLMDNIIELSSIESESFELNEKAIYVENYFRAIIEPYRIIAHKKKLKFMLNMDSDLPESLLIDSEKVREIIVNLVDNAIKFTTRGTVQITISSNSINSTKNTVNLSIVVEDTGKGIEKHNQDKIFEIFEKKDNCSDIEFQGTGLGLSINRKLAKLMHGSLTVKSVISQGSAFTLYLENIEIALHSTNEEVNEKNIDFSLIKPEGATIVVIDEEVENSNVVVESFKDSAVNVLSFNKPRDVIEVLQSKEVDLILVDLEMLIEDDSAVSKVIKMMSKAPVVTLTNSRIKGIEFSSDGVQPVSHILKPISRLSLFKVALKILHAQEIVVVENDVLVEVDDDVALDLEKLKLFLSIANEKLNPLYDKAVKTNNFNAIKAFAQSTSEYAKKYEIEEMDSFAKVLIEKVDMFEIDSIDELLKLYKSKINDFKSLIKE